MLLYGVRLYCAKCYWQGIYADCLDGPCCPNCESPNLIMQEEDDVDALPG